LQGGEGRISEEVFIMTVKPVRRKNSAPFDERLQRLAGEVREAAGKLPDGQQRASAPQGKGGGTAANLNQWLSSAGQQSSR
jgi:hypothetical protein